MEYFLRIEKSQYCSIEIQFSPENYPASFYFRNLSIFKFPLYLYKLVNNISISEENSSIRFRSELDGGFENEFLEIFGREMTECDVWLSIWDGKTKNSTLSKYQFYIIILHISFEITEIFKSEFQTQKYYSNYFYGHLEYMCWFNENPNWSEAMNKFITLFKEKIDNEYSK